MRHCLYLLSLLSLVFVYASASPRDAPYERRPRLNVARKETNAQRLARGLTPATPRNLWLPTRTRRQPITAPSPVPFATAKVGVFRRSDGVQLGYLGHSGMIDLLETTTFQSAIDFRFTYSSPTSQTTNLNSMWYGVPGANLFFGTTSPAPFKIGTGLTSTLQWVTHGSTVAAGSPPTVIEHPYWVAGETSVWSVDRLTGAVTASWINYDGTHTDVQFATLPTLEKGFLRVTGDFESLKASLIQYDTLEELTFRIVLADTGTIIN